MYRVGPELRRQLFDSLTTSARELLLKIYGTPYEFINAERYTHRNEIKVMEEACITFDSALLFEPSAFVILDLMTRLTGRDYKGEMGNTAPIFAAKFAIEDAIFWLDENAEHLPPN